MNDLALSCHECGTARKLMPGDQIYRRDTCVKCGSDLHSCRHCRFFDPGLSNQCRETQAEWINDKESSNFCDFFEPRTSVNLTARGGTNQAQDARSAFDSLFKK